MPTTINFPQLPDGYRHEKRMAAALKCGCRPLVRPKHQIPVDFPIEPLIFETLGSFPRRHDRWLFRRLEGVLACVASSVMSAPIPPSIF